MGVGPAARGVLLPALDGRTPLGFLAAVGLLRLLTRHGAPGGDDDGPVRLAWSPDTCSATLYCRWQGIDDLLAEIERIVDGIDPRGVLPGVPVDLPPPGEAPDGLRLSRNGFADRVSAWLAASGGDGPDAACAGVSREGVARDGVSRDEVPCDAVSRDEVEAWLTGLVTELSLDGRGRVEITLFAAPSGKQSMRTMLEKPLDAVRRHPELLREALLGWRRYPGVTGEYLDHRVLFDAGDAPDGRAKERGVPGATWLALMALPVLRCTAVEGRVSTVGWHRVGPRTADRCLVYPLWSAPLDLAAVTALLPHPLWAEAVADGGLPVGAEAFTVFRVCRAQRRRLPGRTFAGVLAPLPDRVGTLTAPAGPTWD